MGKIYDVTHTQPYAQANMNFKHLSLPLLTTLSLFFPLYFLFFLSIINEGMNNKHNKDEDIIKVVV